MRTLIRLTIQGLRDFTLYPWTQLCTLMAVTLMVFLSGLFLLTLTTLNYELGTTKGETAFQVYWRPHTDMLLIQEQWEQLKLMPWYSSTKTYSPEEALKELGIRLRGKKTDPAKAFPFLTSQNPLPATALVSFVPDEQDTERWVQETAGYLKNLPGVERVVITPLKDELGQAWRHVSHYIMWPSLAFLALILGLVVANTVRLSLFGRAHEIEILQLVGAQNWYIRLPLLINGGLIGFLGGTIALVLLRFIYTQLRDVFNFAPLFLQLRFLPAELCLALIAIPTLTAMVASYLTVRTAGQTHNDYS